ncbi:MAG: hypothetical protein JXA00_02720 [Candidatus Thermoplasmatota archaeon]|nr:hypothetical protein [Candidatus Thermoplasmatota archaeon]
MVKKPRMARSLARTAPKSQEKHLVENAKALQQDPFVLLPRCTGENEKYFQKLRKQLSKVHRFSHDAAKLEKLAHKRGLDGALAGTLLLALSEKAPYLAALSFPTGDVMYAQRGKADREKLIAVQHFDDPVFRLRGIKDIVFKKNLHVYSWDDGYVCTGTQANPPQAFIEFITHQVGFPVSQDTVTCPHITADVAQKKDYHALNYLRIAWTSAQVTIAICENCAKTTRNTMFTISKYLMHPNLSDDFSIDVITPLRCHQDAVDTSRTTDLQRYLAGQLTDYELIKHRARDHEAQVKQLEERLFVLDGVSYGTEPAQFIDALHPTPYERKALDFFLEHSNEPVIVSKITPSKLIERYWCEYGRDFLATVISDPAMVDSFLHLDETPANIITLAFEYQQRQEILSQLPVFPNLPPLAAFADTVARTYRTFGEHKALSEIKKHPDTPKGKSLAYAFLLAFGKAAEVKWKYTTEESEYGGFLQPHAQKLLEASPQQYATTLQELLIACGSSERIPT